MPQLQPGQSTLSTNNEAPKLYGVDKQENSIPFQEKLMRLFKPQEFVTIKNIDDEPVYWQYLPESSETESFSEDGIQRQIYREKPEMWGIAAGEVEVIVGASAYRALDAMYKNYTAKKVLKKFSDPTAPQFNEKNEHLPKNFNFADGGAQDEFIKMAYLGKATPSFQGIETAAAAPELPVAGVPAFQPPAAQPVASQEPVAAVADPTIPVPKTTVGAPVVPPVYAEPDSAKALSGAAK